MGNKALGFDHDTIESNAKLCFPLYSRQKILIMSMYKTKS